MKYLLALFVAIVASGHCASTFFIDPAFAAQEEKQAKQESTSDKKESGDAKLVNPTGSWRLEFEWNGAQVKDVFRLTLGKGGKVTGMLHRNKDTKLKIKKGKIKGNVLSFSVSMDYEGTEWVTDYKGKVKGDEIDGAVVLSGDDKSFDFPWKPKRSVQLEDVTGVWDIVIVSPDGDEFKSSLDVSQTGEKVKAVYTGSRGQKVEVDDVRVEKNNLRFSVEREINDTVIKLDYRGRPYGGSIKGEVDYDLDGNTGVTEFSAKRRQPKKEAKKEKSKG